MNPPFHLRVSSLVALACLLSACGQTGPLYMPVKPPPRQTVPAGSPPLPATATPPVPVSP